MEIHVNIRLESNHGVVFGAGRYMILKEVDEHGSLKKAAENLGMSYRAAWGKIKKSEELLGQKLIEKETNKTGLHLTEFGRSMVDGYSRLVKETEPFLAQSGAALLALATSAHPLDE
jgi:molybdate transport system regulatory protein